MKSKGFSEEWLKSKGLVETEKNVFAPTAKNNVGEAIHDVEMVVKGKVNNSPDFEYFGASESVLQIKGVVAGLNGSNGLMRSHWSSIAKQKDLYRKIIKDHFISKKVHRHFGAVTIQYIGYKTYFMDWDNFCSSFKHIGDSLVKEGVIVDDNPKIVIQFLPQQIKCKRVEQRVVIIIKDAY